MERTFDNIPGRLCDPVSVEVGRPCCLQLEAAGPGKIRDSDFNRRKERDGDGDRDGDRDGDGDGERDGDRDKDRGRWMIDR